jgi:hypothetical protein
VIKAWTEPSKELISCTRNAPSIEGTILPTPLISSPLASSRF